MARPLDISAIKYPSSPDTDRLQALYAQELKKLAGQKQQIDRLLIQQIPEQEAVRLSRASQLAKRYAPDRAPQERQPAPSEIFYKKLKTLFNFLRTQPPPVAEAGPPNPYLLAQDTIAALRMIRDLDFRLTQATPAAGAEAILNQSHQGSPLRHEIAETSLTLSYERKNWGVERICLDGLQNHLPSDAKGSNVWVQCLVGKQWVSLPEARDQKENIGAVRFVDDGVGFDVKNLSLLWSTKSEDPESRGQFGEGMKMIAASAVRENLGMVLESQNWRAVPRAKTLNVNNTRAGQDETVDQLVFDIEHFAMDQSFRGSRTTFLSPTPEFIDEVLQLDCKILELDPRYKPLFTSRAGQIVRNTPGGIFVKGIRITKAPTVFSYNFDDVETNRDRNRITNDYIDNRVQRLVRVLNDKRLIKTLLQEGLKGSGNDEAHEYACYHSQIEYPSLWRESFYEVFGPEAVLDTGFKPPEMFQNQDIQKISMVRNLTDKLIACGVKTDKDAIPACLTEIIPTSLTLEYGRDIWTEERMLLDAIQNHLPGDSGGNRIALRFKTREGNWADFDRLGSFPDNEIEAIKIYDNGQGYDHRMLGLFHSTKSGSDSSGKFGEGLKMFCAAALRAGVEVTLRSRNWQAAPRAVRQTIEGQEIDQLVFEVVHELKAGGLNDGDNDKDYQSSATTFTRPTTALLAEFRKAHHKVLAIENLCPLVKTNCGDILRLDSGQLFVRQILIPGNHQLKYSYHFKNFDIRTRDRNAVAKDDLLNEVAGVWSQMHNPEVIKDYLLQAAIAASNGADLLEFQTEFTPRHQALWMDVYKKTFGGHAALRDVKSQDFNALHNNQHLGLSIVTLPSAVCGTLKKCRDENGDRIANYHDTLKEANKIEIIPDEDLTETERETLTFLQEEVYTAIVPAGLHVKICAFEPRGKHIAAGLGGPGFIGINRFELAAGKTRAADVFIHELAHEQTGGASDASANFRDFLSMTFARVMVKAITTKDTPLHDTHVDDYWRQQRKKGDFPSLGG